MNLDDELKLALQRKQPPPGFRQRVIAATQQRRPKRAWRPIAAAALLTLVLGGTTARYIEQRREGEHAKEQVLLALRITSHTLRDTREHVIDISK